MNTLVIGYTDGIIVHAYIKDIHSGSHAISFSFALTLCKNLISSGHALHHVQLSDTNDFDYIEF